MAKMSAKLSGGVVEGFADRLGDPPHGDGDAAWGRAGVPILRADGADATAGGSHPTRRVGEGGEDVEDAGEVLVVRPSLPTLLASAFLPASKAECTRWRFLKLRCTLSYIPVCLTSRRDYSE